MKGFNSEMIECAKSARSAEELYEIAKENNVELTAEEAVTYYAQLNPTQGELSDDELDNVAGGACSGESVNDEHVRFIGGKCSNCGAENPSGYFSARNHSHGVNYSLKNMDCCGGTMSISGADCENLVAI